MDDIDSIMRLYGGKTPITYEISDNSHGENDLRFTIVAEYHDLGKIVIKAAKNLFTTQQRVDGWARLTEHYNALGVYAPRFLRNNSGEYSAIAGDFVVYAEEFAKFAPSDHINYEQSSEARLISLGRIAANPLVPLLPWPSPYAMFDKFDDGDNAPEIYGNGLKLIRRISENYPAFSARAAGIMREYECRRAAFEPVYRALPKASFQADMNKSNLLFDDGNFAGLLDFNLAGTDAVLAYAFYESHYYMTEDEIRNAIIYSEMSDIDLRTRRNLGYIAREYRFTSAEREAFNMFCNLATPFWGANDETYHELMDEHGAQHLPQILNFIEWSMTRRNDWLP